MPQKPNLKDINGLELDRRVWAYDEDRRIAEVALKGRLEGEWEWFEPKVGFVKFNESPMLYSDTEQAEYTHVTQVLANESLLILWNELIPSESEPENEGWTGWTLVKLVEDSYIGWIGGTTSIQTQEKFFSIYPRPVLKETKLTVLGALAYMTPSIKCAHIQSSIPFGSHIFVQAEFNDWLNISISGFNNAWIHKSALEPSTLPPLEWVKGFLGTPYLWGGRTAWGIDCSGLAQMYFRYQNVYIPRDADQQEEAFAKVMDPRAGDLAFFDGHVGILLEQNERGNWRILHANSRYMSVTVDTLNEGEYGQYLSSILHGYGRWEGKIGVYWKPK